MGDHSVPLKHDFVVSLVEQGQKPGCRLTSGKDRLEGRGGCSGQGTGPEDWVKTTGLTVGTMFGGMVPP